MSLFNEFDDDSDEYAIVELDSDNGSVLSSDEEEEIDEDIDISPPVKCTNDVDNFEQEMRQELDKKMEEIEEKNELNTKLPIEKNEPEELFYDPQADDNDQIWMDAVHGCPNRSRPNRSRPSPKTAAIVTSKPVASTTTSPLSKKSDAVLNCPGCMVVLTTDCQRHEKYESQYRSMFVSNCRVDEESLRYPTRKGDTLDDDIYNVILCSVCSTRVGVIDAGEVYHFFNILASY